jgi:hypothetical protein
MVLSTKIALISPEPKKQLLTKLKKKQQQRLQLLRQRLKLLRPLLRPQRMPSQMLGPPR